MNDEVTTPIINLSSLKDWQQTFQKEMGDLIDIYLIDANKKISTLKRALEERNTSSISTLARELRESSVDVGAIHFSFHCLNLEVAAQELRWEILPKLIPFLEKNFEVIRQELLRLKTLVKEERKLNPKFY